MSNYFLAPLGDERENRNFYKTLQHAISYGSICNELDEEGKKLLSAQELIFAWGNSLGTQADWRRMEVGDVVIFYGKKKFSHYGLVTYKQHSSRLAQKLGWSNDSKGRPFEYVFFLGELIPLDLPLEAFNLVAGYKLKAVLGFQRVTPPYVHKIVEKLGSVEQFLSKFTSDDLPPIESEEVYLNVPDSVELKLSDRVLIPYKTVVLKERKTLSRGPIDFDARSKRNARVGSKGEEHVVRYERGQLIARGRADLAERVERVSITQPELGYDIRSFDENGNEIMIEVKTTTTRQGSQFRFYISENEHQKALSSGSRYRMYFVFDVHSEQPILHIAINPFLDEAILNLKPVQYLAFGSFAIKK